MTGLWEAEEMGRAWACQCLQLAAAESRQVLTFSQGSAFQQVKLFESLGLQRVNCSHLLKRKDQAEEEVEERLVDSDEIQEEIEEEMNQQAYDEEDIQVEEVEEVSEEE